jgi:hypothetical protein
VKKRVITGILTLVFALSIQAVASAPASRCDWGSKGDEVKNLQQLLKDRGTSSTIDNRLFR